MKSHFIKQATVFFIFALLAFTANAQFTETFEDDVPGENTVFSNGQSFTLTNAFLTYSDRNARGYARSYGFVDNINSISLNQVNSIKTTDGTKISVKNLWIFTSKNSGNNPSSDGSLIIYGKLAGVVVFTIYKTTGFNPSYAANNGFTYLDLATESGVNNSNLVIDELEFVLQGNFNYLAFDNFTWAPQIVMPVSLVSYSATLQSSGKVSLNWQTSSESNSSYFVVERSTDGTNFKTIANVKAAGNSNVSINYIAIDAYPADGVNYYRLVGYDIDGKMKQLGIKAITVSFNRSSSLYPNPAFGGVVTLKSTLSGKANFYVIVDMSGKIVKTGIISDSQQLVNISQLGAGNYIMKLSDGQVIKWVKN